MRLRLVFNDGVEYIYTNNTDNELIDMVERKLDSRIAVTTEDGKKVVFNLENLCFAEKEGYTNGG